MTAMKKQLDEVKGERDQLQLEREVIDWRKRDRVIVEMSERVEQLTEESDTNKITMADMRRTIADLKSELGDAEANNQELDIVRRERDELCSSTTKIDTHSSDADFDFISKHSDALASANDEIADDVTQAADLILRLNSKIEDLKAQKEAADEENNSLKSNIVTLEDLIGTAGEDSEEIESLQEAFELAKEENAKLVASVEEIEQTNSDLTASIEEADQLRVQLELAEQTNSDLTASVEEVDQLRVQLEMAEEEAESLREEVARADELMPQNPSLQSSAAEKQLEELKSEVASLHKSVASSKAKEASLSMANASLKNSVKVLQNQNATLKSATDSAEDHSQLRDQLSTAEEERDQLGSELEALCSENQSLTSQVAELENQSLTSQVAALSSLRSEKRELFSEVATLSSLRSENESVVSSLRSENESLVSSNQSLTSSNHSLTSQLSALNLQLTQAKSEQTIAASNTQRVLANSTNSILANNATTEDEIKNIKKEHTVNIREMQDLHSRQLNGINESLKIALAENERKQIQITTMEEESYNLQTLLTKSNNQLNTANTHLHNNTVKTERRLANLTMSHQAEVTTVEAEIEALEEQSEQLKKYNTQLKSSNDKMQTKAADPTTPAKERALKKSVAQLETEMLHSNQQHETIIIDLKLQMKKAKIHYNAKAKKTDENNRGEIAAMIRAFAVSMEKTIGEANSKVSATATKLQRFERAHQTLTSTFNDQEAEMHCLANKIYDLQTKNADLEKSKATNTSIIAQLNSQISIERETCAETRDLLALAHVNKAGEGDKMFSAALVEEVGRAMQVQEKKIDNYATQTLSQTVSQVDLAAANEKSKIMENRAIMAEGRLAMSLKASSSHAAALAVTKTQVTALTKEVDNFKTLADERAKEIEQLIEGVRRCGQGWETTVERLTDQVKSAEARREMEVESARKRAIAASSRVNVEVDLVRKDLDSRLKTKEDELLTMEEGLGHFKATKDSLETNLTVLRSELDETKKQLQKKTTDVERSELTIGDLQRSVAKEASLRVENEVLANELKTEVDNLKEEKISLQQEMALVKEDVLASREIDDEKGVEMGLQEAELEALNDAFEESELERDAANKKLGLLSAALELANRKVDTLEEGDAKATRVMAALKEEKNSLLSKIEIVGDELEAANVSIDRLEEELKNSSSSTELLKNERAFEERKTRDELSEVRSQRELLLNQKADLTRQVEDLNKIVTAQMAQIEQMKLAAELSKAAVGAVEVMEDEIRKSEDTLKDAESALRTEKESVVELTNVVSETESKLAATEDALKKETARCADMSEKLDMERYKVIEMIQKHNALKGRRKAGWEKMEQDLECSQIEGRTLKGEVESFKEMITSLRAAAADGAERTAFETRIEIEGIRDENRKYRKKSIEFLAELAAAESRKREVESVKKSLERELVETNNDLVSTRDKIESFEDQIKLMECRVREESTPTKFGTQRSVFSPSPTVVKMFSKEEKEAAVEEVREEVKEVRAGMKEQLKRDLDEQQLKHKAVVGELQVTVTEKQQKLTQLKFELKASVQQANSMQQRSEKLELLLGERNETLLQHFHTDSIVEELKSALHNAFEKYEHCQTSLAEAENDVAALRSQLDESVEHGIELEQTVSELRVVNEDLVAKIGGVKEEGERVRAEMVVEVEGVQEEAEAMRNELVAENESLRRKLQRKEMEMEEAGKQFHKDVRSRLDVAEEELAAERIKRGAVVEGVRVKLEAAKDDILMLKERLVKAETQRDEESVRCEEFLGELEGCREGLSERSEQVAELTKVNEENARLLQIEANRRLLELKLSASVGSPLGGMTPGKLLMRETPRKEGWVFGQNLGSAFKKTSVGTAMTPVAETPTPKVRSAGVSTQMTPQSPMEDWEETSRKWQKAANSLQSALDSAIVSRDAYASTSKTERLEKERILALYEKEKTTVRNELNDAFKVAKVNLKKLSDTTAVAEVNGKTIEVLKGELGAATQRLKEADGDLAASRKQVKWLTSNIEELGEKFRDVVKAKHAKDAEAFGLAKERGLLEIQLKDCLSERNYLKKALEAVKESKLLDNEGWDSERGRLEKEIEEMKKEARVVVEKKKKEVVVEGVKEVGGEKEGGGGGMVLALKAELREKDVEVQRLRKKMKGVEDRENLNVNRERVREMNEGWKTLKPRGGGRDVWQEARQRKENNKLGVREERDERARRVEELERAFGSISKKLSGV
ncbi:hypothetical protein TL16_g04801 [Triparma laevis f. inornata]|uniref:Uncharacterized protein n=1 Tax=Triparma laevis f. inornata TaxID=1714386 RepID=A0A9W7AHM4_9STRA|nr:hypothetical protein TL16_g04801 [Triparma laevis f. inornata]